ncbi:hypothetical protein EVAR_19019_1 [Eumeta japonica]|uniref:Uncharacterized protein n=1 Tax=Eumeta variegata TaxID=151549 RepID=A0A4C1V704_EUMVA|nr:hypothetical protein EVAR_19019_1 [Eumeta japonica]
MLQILEVFPERPAIKYFNPEYLKWINFTIKRYGRQSIYYLNVEGHLKHAWGNNVTIEFVFYEFLSNEYRRSFVQWKWKICDGVLNEPYIGHFLARGGLQNKSCPHEAGEYHLMNLTVDMGSFKSVWPFEKCRLEFTIKSENNITIGIGERPCAQYKDPCLSPGHAPQGEYIVSSGSDHIPIYCDSVGSQHKETTLIIGGAEAGSNSAQKHDRRAGPLAVECIRKHGHPLISPHPNVQTATSHCYSRDDVIFRPQI